MDFHRQEDVRASDDIRLEPQPYIQSQYSASPVIKQILDDFRSNIRPDADIQTFYKNMMDIKTATGVGLDTWGNIVGIARTIILDDDTKITLDDDFYRTLLMYKALANITDASLYTLNYMINKLFPQYNAMVFSVIIEAQDENGTYYNTYPMHVRWLFQRYLTDEELALFKVGGTLCVGAGVGWDLYQIDKENVFGFAGSGLQPFNCGVFDPVGTITE